MICDGVEVVSKEVESFGLLQTAVEPPIDAINGASAVDLSSVPS